MSEMTFEEKMKRLLDGIGYQGPRPEYEEIWKFENLSEEMDKKQLNFARLAVYTEKSKLIFAKLDQVMDTKKKGNIFWYALYKLKQW